MNELWRDDSPLHVALIGFVLAGDEEEEEKNPKRADWLRMERSGFSFLNRISCIFRLLFSSPFVRSLVPGKDSAVVISCHVLCCSAFMVDAAVSRGAAASKKATVEKMRLFGLSRINHGESAAKTIVFRSSWKH